jgi:RimJ/RimL family protein N-acetyltransferase
MDRGAGRNSDSAGQTAPVIEPVETPRLLLRPISLDDVDALVGLDADPEVMRYITGGAPTPRPEAERIVARSIGHRWVAHERDGNHFAGWFGLRPSAGSDRELGYRLPRACWGRGLATEGARALVDLAFTELGASRVWAQTMTVNARSRRVMERCGLRYVRTFYLEWPEPIEGTEEGDVEYELTRADWGSA